MESIRLKQGHYTDFTYTVSDSNGSPLDLTDYDGIKFIMINAKKDVIINAEDGIFVDKVNGKISYAFKNTETDVKGKYIGYFSLLQSGSKKLAVPVDDFNIEILEDHI